MIEFSPRVQGFSMSLWSFRERDGPGNRYNTFPGRRSAQTFLSHNSTYRCSFTEHSNLISTSPLEQKQSCARAQPIVQRRLSRRELSQYVQKVRRELYNHSAPDSERGKQRRAGENSSNQRQPPSYIPPPAYSSPKHLTEAPRAPERERQLPGIAQSPQRAASRTHSTSPQRRSAFGTVFCLVSRREEVSGWSRSIEESLRAQVLPQRDMRTDGPLIPCKDTTEKFPLWKQPRHHQRLPAELTHWSSDGPPQELSRDINNSQDKQNHCVTLLHECTDENTSSTDGQQQLQEATDCINISRIYQFQKFTPDRDFTHELNNSTSQQQKAANIHESLEAITTDGQQEINESTDVIDGCPKHKDNPTTYQTKSLAAFCELIETSDDFTEKIPKKHQNQSRELTDERNNSTGDQNQSRELTDEKNNSSGDQNLSRELTDENNFSGDQNQNQELIDEKNNSFSDPNRSRELTDEKNNSSCDQNQTRELTDENNYSSGDQNQSRELTDENNYSSGDQNHSREIIDEKNNCTSDQNLSQELTDEKNNSSSDQNQSRELTDEKNKSSGDQNLSRELTDENNCSGDQNETREFTDEKNNSYGDQNLSRELTDENNFSGDQNETREFTDEKNNSYGDQNQSRELTDEKNNFFGDQNQSRELIDENNYSSDDQNHSQELSDEKNNSSGDQNQSRELTNENNSSGNQNRTRELNDEKNNSTSDQNQSRELTDEKNNFSGDQNQSRERTDEKNNSTSDKNESRELTDENNNSSGDQSQSRELIDEKKNSSIDQNQNSVVVTVEFNRLPEKRHVQFVCLTEETDRSSFKVPDQRLLQESVQASEKCEGKPKKVILTNRTAAPELTEDSDTVRSPSSVPQRADPPTDCERPLKTRGELQEMGTQRTGACGPVSSAEPAGDLRSSRTRPYSPACFLRDAVQRIRKHTAPDSETEEDEELQSTGQY